MAWAQARARAVRAAGAPLPPVRLPLADAFGGTLAVPLEALSDLPAFDTSAMDGWAVSGPGPWRLAADPCADGILAGRKGAAPLADGTAVRIATGAQLPPGATAVLRSEDGQVRRGAGVGGVGNGGVDLLHDCGSTPLEQGRDIRPRGQECRTGEPLLPPGTAVTPAVLGLAAAAGCDLLAVHRRPTVELLVLGDELLDAGPSKDGRTRDALGPLLPSWLRSYGARVGAVRRVGDDLGLLTEAVLRSTADIVVTTGGTAAGPVDFLHLALAGMGARLLVDGVRVRPGHPMLLAALPAEPGKRTRFLVGLPGNPLAAVAGVVTLAEPLLRTLGGCPAAPPYLVEAAVALPGHPQDTRLVPVALPARGVLPLAFDGPAMLRGLALAEGLAVVPPGGLPAGARVEILDVPAG
ncbi:molybdopterin molybdotransferase MoeA [Streptacidiphilus cavernicola]|uniref:Molybdopterin molybdenumtransferase n=1 Tax=Streptacidiphilus cavernicola TaxID=3342716 RepID=A0ABV6VW04_9ACTN